MLIISAISILSILIYKVYAMSSPKPVHMDMNDTLSGFQQTERSYCFSRN